MNRLLAKLCSKATGVYFDGREVHVVRVAAMPVGYATLDHVVEAPDGEEWHETSRRILNRIGAAAVALAVPLDDCYLATRPYAGGSAGSASPDVLLRESLRSSAEVDRMVASTIHSRPGTRDLVSIAACPKQDILPLSKAAAASSWRLARAEPARAALLRLARLSDRRHRKGVVVRVFLGEDEAVAVLEASGTPIVWSDTPLEHGDESAAVVAQTRSLTTMARSCGVERALDAVVLHGRKDLQPLMDSDWLRQQLDADLRWHEGPSPSGADVAFGAAMGVLAVGDEPSFDLAGGYTPKPSLKEVFPWRDLVAYAAMLLAMAGVLMVRRVEVEGKTVVSESSLLSAHAEDVRKLEMKRRELITKASSVAKVVNTRVAWTAQLRAVVQCLPDSAHLTAVSGAAGMPINRKAATSRQLVIEGTIRAPFGDLANAYLDQFLRDLGRHEDLSAEFPDVQLADTNMLTDDDGRHLVMFKIVCMPKKRATRG